MDNPYKRAEVTQRARRDFLIHLGLYLVAALFMLFLLWLVGPGGGAIVWLLAVWGIGVALHALSLLEPLRWLSSLLDRLGRA